MSEETISQIEDFFLQIENLIELQLQNKVQSQSQPDIERKFKDGKEIVDELEHYNVEQHGLFRYKYHMTYANYLKISGELEKADKQEKLAKKYESFFKKPENTYKLESRLFAETILDDVDQTSDHEEKFIQIQDAVEDELEKIQIQDILGDIIIESIRQTFKQLDKIPKTFEDYKEVVTYETVLYTLADNTINESLINLGESDSNKQLEDQNSKSQKNRDQVISSLNILKSLVSKAAYLKRLAFIFYTLNASNKKEILFSNVLFTEEEINKRFKELALHFHTDKTNRPNTPIWLQEKHKNLGVEIFNFAREFKESLLNDLKELSEADGCIAFHEKKAMNFWNGAIDLRNAAKGRWDKLKMLKKDDIEIYTSDELKQFSVDNGILAYHEYRAACKAADKVKLLKKQVKLRGFMALCLYTSNKFVEAQLYALSAIQLQLRNSQRVTQLELNEMKQIFDKVKNGDNKLKTEININTNSNNTLALVRTVDQELSIINKKTMENSINNDMTKLSIELMLKADRSLIRYQACREEILHAKDRALKHKVAGGIVIGGAATVTGSAAAAAFMKVSEVVLLIGVGSPLAVFGGLVTLSLGIWGGISLWKKGSLILEEPRIREELNKIMVKALKAYDDGEYQKFLEALSEEFKADESLLNLEAPKTGERYLKLKECDDSIISHNLINTLLKHGFRSDGIAYLLNLLGEVLSSGKIKIEGKTTKDLKGMAMNAFNRALSEKLEIEAKKLDDRIRELRKNRKNRRTNYVSTFNKIIDFISLKEYSDVAQEHKDDSQEMPFKLRLEEMRNIARINKAIFDILDTGEEEMSRAIKTIKEIRDSININYQFVNAAKWRYEVVEDLLWVVSGEESSEGSEELPKLPQITYIDNVDNKYSNFLGEQLRQSTSNREKVHLYNKLAAFCEQSAEKEEEINQLNSLFHWKVAQKNYEKAREVDPENLDAALGFAKCLLKLFKYTQVIKLSSTCPNLTSSSEYWRFCSIAHCKQNEYKKARKSINEALKLDNKNKLAVEQKSLLEKLSVKKTIKWRINQYEKGINEIDYFESSNKNKSSVYNILSIDGGGVCGVLPALWLSEIELRARRPISHLFDMITGGIIAAGLSVPTWRKVYDEDLSTIYFTGLHPKFSSLDLLNLYRNQTKKLFVNNNSWTSLFGPKYTNDRSLLFEEYFGGVRLDNALTELVIPAVNENDLTRTHLFTRYDARKHILKNNTFVDALMAATATPTFFPSYKVEGKGVFFDGALHINNPAMAAYEKAIQYNRGKEKISVLSLGTGSYIPDPLDPDLYRGQLFWARNHKAVLPQREGDTDKQMNSILGNRYQRWQVWFEEPIEFDDNESIPYVLELGHQYIEELDSSDENPINKLVESFEKGYES